MSITLYHWTHKKNLPSISAIGLCDRYARTKDGMLYGVTVDRILSGLTHVVNRHGWRPENIVCLSFQVKVTTKLGRPGRRYYRFAGTVPPSDIAIACVHWPFLPLVSSVRPGKPLREPRRKRLHSKRSRMG